MSSHPSPRHRPSAPSLGVRRTHDLRAWALFLLISAVVLGGVPAFTTGAQAQLPEDLPLPPLPPPLAPQPTEEPTGQPTSQPTPQPTEEDPGPAPAPAPAPPGGGAESPFKTAYFTSPTSNLIADQATSDTAQCVVIPESCTPEAQQITGPIRDTIIAGEGAADTAGAAAPAQPVPPDALPLGLLNGEQRYSSAVDIGPPPVGEGKSVDSYLISFQLSSASFAVESPAFREAVTAAISQAGTGGPEAFQAFLSNVAGGGTPLLTPSFPGIEACVAEEAWPAGDNQPVENEPSVDPLFCSPAALPDENGVVTFDMTFPAQEALNSDPEFRLDWSNGILIRPLAAQNLAYGDRDYSTNYYAYIESLGENPPATSFNEVDNPTPPPFTPGGQNNGFENPISSGSTGSTGGGFSSPGRGSSSGGGGFTRPATTGFGTGTGGQLPSSPAGSSTGTAMQLTPGPLGGADVPAPEAADAPLGAPAADAQVPLNERSGSFPLIFLLLPAIIGGAFWYGRVLDAAPMTQVVRAGAMTRLLRERGFAV